MTARPPPTSFRSDDGVVVSVDRRLIVGDAKNEQVAVVTIAVPAGGEVEIDRTWRFEGWQLTRKPWRGGVKLKVEEPQRISIDEAST
jgi:hypothetical protein